MRRLLVVLLLALLSGCGGGAAEDEPAKALKAYFDAMEDKDWERACDLLSDRGVKGVWESESGCESFISDYRPEGVSPTVLKAMENGDYAVEVTGDTATVTPEGTGGYALVRESGKWLLHDPS